MRWPSPVVGVRSEAAGFGRAGGTALVEPVRRGRLRIGQSHDGECRRVDRVRDGQSYEGIPHGNFATVAIDATTGTKRWVSRYNGGGYDSPIALGVSPEGASVFVTGWSYGGASGQDYVTVAYGSALPSCVPSGN